MVKIIDVDKLFDEYISDYVYKNIGKVKPEEIENKIPELYIEFGDKKLKELDDMTPNSYYKSFSGKELLKCLKTHLEKGVSVSDFLCEALTDGKKHEDALVEGLKEEDNEEFTIYIMNMLNEMSSDKCSSRYMEYVLFDYSETIKELATEYLKEHAESVKESVLSHFADASDSVRWYLTEILSCCKFDDRVFEILVEEFKSHPDKVIVYANYLAKYGDDRAIKCLTERIEDEKLSYADFQELRFAIEALGGEYTKQRDFTKDKSFKKIKGNYTPNKKILG